MTRFKVNARPEDGRIQRRPEGHGEREIDKRWEYYYIQGEQELDKISELHNYIQGECAYN